MKAPIVLAALSTLALLVAACAPAPYPESVAFVAPNGAVAPVEPYWRAARATDCPDGTMSDQRASNTGTMQCANPTASGELY